MTVGDGDAKTASRGRFPGWLKRVLQLAMGIALVVALFWFLGETDPRELVRSAEFHPGWVAVGLTGTFAASVVTAARWQLLAEVMGGTRLRYIVYFHALVLTRFLGQFTSTLGMDLVGRGVALRRGGSDRDLGHAATQVVLERMLDLVLPIVLLGWVMGVRELAWPPSPSLIGLAIVFFIGAVLLLSPGVRVALWAYSGIRGLLGRPQLEVTNPTVDLSLSAKVAGYSLARFATVVVQFWGIARGVGIDIGYIEMTMATPLAQLAGMVGITPGGLGFIEFGWAGGLPLAGVDTSSIALFLVAQKLGVVTFFGLLKLDCLAHQKPSTMNEMDRRRAQEFEAVYMGLAGLFLAALVACNLIFQKFFVVAVPLPGGRTYVFEQSVGLLAYPVTFLVTDILSEIYGRVRANRVVTAGLVASVFVVGLVELADRTHTAGFGVDDATFHEVFGLSKVAIFASMVAYLVAQYFDIRLFHFWRRLTKGKHLWLRNNGSTITSQLADTVIVLCLLAAFGAAGITWQAVPALILNGLLFKWLFAALDTPLFYAAVGFMRRRYGDLCLGPDEEDLESRDSPRRHLGSPPAS